MMETRTCRGKCCDCHLRINNCCDQWGEDPTCKKWLPNDYRKQETYTRTKVFGGAYGHNYSDDYDYYYSNYWYA